MADEIVDSQLELTSKKDEFLIMPRRSATVAKTLNSSLHPEKFGRRLAVELVNLNERCLCSLA